MRFNYEDLKRGNVSQERIREVVQSIILKVDKKQFDPEVLERTKSSLIDTLQKQFIFKRYDGAVPDPTHDRAEEQPYIDEKIFKIKIRRANLQLLIAETTLQIQQDENKKNALLDNLEQLEKEHREKMIDDATYQQRLLQARSELEQIQKLLAERTQLLSDLKDLIKHRDGLIGAIQENERSIQVARQQSASNIIINADKIMIGDKKFFKDMPPENIELFVNGRLAILEAKTREVHALEEIRSDRKKEILATLPAGTTTQFQQSKLFAQIDRDIEAQIKTIDKKEIDKIRELAQVTQCTAFTPTDSDAAIAAIIAKYDNSEYIKPEQEAFKELMKETLKDNSSKREQIRDSNINIDNIELSINKIDKELTENSSYRQNRFGNSDKGENLSNAHKNKILGHVKEDNSYYLKDLNDFDLLDTKISSEKSISPISNSLSDLNFSTKNEHRTSKPSQNNRA